LKVTVLVTLLSLAYASTATAQCNLSDSFDGSPQIAWEFSDPGRFQIQDGMLEVQYTGTHQWEAEYAIVSECKYADMAIHVDLRDLNWTRNKIIDFRKFYESNGDEVSGYAINMRPAPYNDLLLAKRLDGPGTDVFLATVPAPHDTGDWLHIDVFATGPRIEIHLNGVPVIDYTDPDPILEGWVALATVAGGNLQAHVQFDNFIVEAYNAVGAEKTSWGAIKAQF